MAGDSRAGEWLCAPQRRVFHVFPAGPMCSLRRALLLWLVPLFLLVGIGSAAFSYWNSSRMVSAFMDGQMQQLAQALGASQQWPALPAAGAQRIHASGTYATQVYDRSGRLLFNSWDGLPALATPHDGFADLQVRGARWRVYAAAAADGRRVQVWQSGEFRRGQAAERAIAAVAPVLILLPLAIAILWGVARAMSNAVKAIGGRAALQDAHSIAELPLERVPEEIQPLVVSFNGLLTRLRDAFAEQRQFVQDAAHELRTPIAALALQMENVRGDLPPGACAQSFAQLEAGLKRAQRLVEQLLKLSRQQGPFSEAPATLDLRAQLHESIDSLIAVADQRGIDLGMVDLTEGGAAPTWRCAAGDLRSVLDNLVENALRYTPPGGVVDVRLSRDGASPVVEVVDSGPGIPPELLERVFDRFYRVPGSDARGSGLGLAIAAAAAQRCGLRVRLRNRADRSGLVARVEPRQPEGALPLTAASESAHGDLSRAAYSEVTVRAMAPTGRASH
jgi:two-component system, OmpR family, sensor kinase